MDVVVADTVRPGITAPADALQEVVIVFEPGGRAGPVKGLNDAAGLGQHSPVSLIRRLTLQLKQALRAARVILDIGLHCEMRIPGDERFHPGERWQPEMGLPFLIERTGYQSEYLASEVGRYLGMPGQAISYKVGERVWLEGRERAKLRLGAKFDLRQFHKAMLEMGTMGLDQLRAELDAFGSPMPDEIVSAASA